MEQPIILINRYLDKTFRKVMDEMGTKFECTQELEDGNRYKIHITSVNELWYMGLHFGMTVSSKIANGEELK